MAKAVLKTIGSSVTPSRFSDVKGCLKEVYRVLKAQEDSMSYLKFSELLGLGRCNASYLLMSGQRKLTLKTARKIADALNLTGVERGYFLALAKFQSAKTTAEQEKDYPKLLEARSQCVKTKGEQFLLQFFSSSLPTAVFELLALPGSQDDPRWLSQHILKDVSEKEVCDALKILEHLDLIRFDEDRERWSPSSELVATPHELRSLVVKTYHREMIQWGIDALFTLPASERFFASATIGVACHQLEELKALTLEYKEKVLALSKSAAAKEQVLQVNIQLFPIARWKKNDP